MMKPKDLELEDQQESDVWQKEGGKVVGDNEPNCAPSPEDQAALA
jgi:hypothetical protein